MKDLPGADPSMLQAGLLMESAQAQQSMAEEQMRRLQAHIRDLDAVVRAEIRRTMLEEMHAVAGEARNAVQALQRVRRAASLSSALWSIGVLAVGTTVPIGIISYLVPTAPEIQKLRDERASLRASVADLERSGGRAQWRRCGDSQRLCVRVDRSAPVFGDHADFLIVKGY